MLRVEEPGTDFVQLLVRTVVLPPTAPPAAAPVPSENPEGPGQSAAQTADDDDGNTGVSEGTPPSAVAGGSDSDTAASVLQQGLGLSPAAVESVLSSQSGCEVCCRRRAGGWWSVRHSALVTFAGGWCFSCMVHTVWTTDTTDRLVRIC